ncbi:MAG: hypothetical protein RLZZ203_1319 [Cyanobacteriota bacterium]|jgi:hypothetical protein
MPDPLRFLSFSSYLVQVHTAIFLQGSHLHLPITAAM